MNRRLALVAAATSLVSLASGMTRRARAADSGEINHKLLQAFLDALTTHDMKKFASLYVENGYIQHQALATNAASLAGRDAVVTYFAKRIEAFPDLVVTSDVSLTEGDLICANLVYTGTHKGEYLGVQPSGRRVTFNSTDIIKVRDGKFVEHWGAADLLGLIQQLRG